MTKSEYEAKKAQYVEKIEKIRTKVKADGRNLTADERDKLESLLLCVESLNRETIGRPLKPDVSDNPLDRRNSTEAGGAFFHAGPQRNEKLP